MVCSNGTFDTAVKISHFPKVIIGDVLLSLKDLPQFVIDVLLDLWMNAELVKGVANGQHGSVVSAEEHYVHMSNCFSKLYF